MDCSLPGFSIHGISQARVLEWVAISFSRGSSWPRDWTQVSLNAVRCFTIRATMNQGKLEVIKQEMARMDINILGISELKWTRMGGFNSDDHCIYYCEQESLRRNGVALSSVQFSRSVMSDSLRPHELQHARPPYPSPTPRVHSNSGPNSQQKCPKCSTIWVQ